jgi:plastocyanin
MRSSLLCGSGVALAGAVLLWGCGGSSGGGSSTPTSPSTPSTPTPQTVTVSIVGSIGNNAYRPNPVAANSGDTVVFKNNDATMHHVVLDDGSADLGDIAPGATSRGVTVRTTNAVKYHCTVHPSMVGAINGAEAPTPPPCPDPYGYGC